MLKDKHVVVLADILTLFYGFW